MNELEYIRELEKNPLLAFTFLNIIDKFYADKYIKIEILNNYPDLKLNLSKQDYILTPSRFYRIVFMLSHGLRKKGLDLKLPYYWYKSGPVIYLKNIPKVFKVMRVNKTQQIAAIYERWKDIIVSFEECEDCFSDAIILTLNSDKLSKYTKLDVIYEYSPSELHKALTALQNEVYKVSKKGRITEKNKKHVANLLEQLNFTFMSDNYPELKPVFSETISLIDKNLEDINPEFMRCLLKKFLDVFSLGLKAKENENIDAQTLHKWNSDYKVALNTSTNAFKNDV
ncbi:MAG TPA: hypothetical protein VEG44_09305 [Candidatus Acidoferrales bacterium]|nr:hypothetical protein [Candidatus Acidoferrales bacterium]